MEVGADVVQWFQRDIPAAAKAENGRSPGFDELLGIFGEAMKGTRSAICSIGLELFFGRTLSLLPRTRRAVLGPGVYGFVSTAEARVGRPLTPLASEAARRTARRCAAGAITLGGNGTAPPVCHDGCRAPSRVRGRRSSPKNKDLTFLRVTPDTV
jgi:hypothetical protein